MPAIVKRMSVWFGEMVCVLLLIGVLSVMLAGRSERWTRWEDFVLLLVWTAAVFMFGSGYLLTTGIIGVFFRGQQLCLYPMIAALLFVAHDQFFYRGLRTPSLEEMKFVVAGGCIAFVCTFAGGWILRRWMWN